MSTIALLQQTLGGADVHLNGYRPWDVRINDPRAYRRALLGGAVGIGESYVEGEWDCDAIDELVFRLYSKHIDAKMEDHWSWRLHGLLTWAIGVGSRLQSRRVAEQHYNLGNDLFKAMLDPRMVYTCAYWKDASDLAVAQERKLDLVCRKIGLQPGMRVLDIGGGWGSFVKFAVERYGVSAVNISVSEEQIELAKKRCQGLPIENRVQDYRDIDEQFDAIVSLGMIEHVGPAHYPEYMNVVDRCLREDGLFLLHCIGSGRTTYNNNPWIEKYVFPGLLPSIKQLSESVEEHFIIEDLHNFGADYDRTLMEWWRNFDARWCDLKDHYPDKIYRRWKLYLQSCAGAFRARSLQVWQFVMSKDGVPGGYQSIR